MTETPHPRASADLHALIAQFDEWVATTDTYDLFEADDALLITDVRQFLAALLTQREQEWRCFHCDDVFKSRAEALEHFGESLDDDPLCKIKADEGGLAVEIRRLNKELDEAYRDRNSYENDARLYHELDSEVKRLTKGHGLFMYLDYIEGEKIVLQERVKELESLLTQRDAPQEPQTDHGMEQSK